MAQVAAVPAAVLMHAAGQGDRGQKRTQKNQAGKRPLGSRNLLCRDADGPYSIAGEKGCRALAQEKWVFPELECRFPRMSGMVHRSPTE